MGSIRLPAGSFRVCLGSFTQPWSFGPYARQLTVLAGQLAKKHVVMWLALGYHDTEVRIKVPGLPENVGMLGGDFPRNQGVYVSSINALLVKHKMDVFISLMDLNRVFVDEMFSPLSISWFPNHFVSLDLHSRHALTAYDAVAVLGPSDATRVKEQLPHKHVMHIPPHSATSSVCEVESQLSPLGCASFVALRQPRRSLPEPIPSLLMPQSPSSA